MDISQYELKTGVDERKFPGAEGQHHPGGVLDLRQDITKSQRHLTDEGRQGITQEQEVDVVTQLRRMQEKAKSGRNELTLEQLDEDPYFRDQDNPESPEKTPYERYIPADVRQRFAD